MESLHFESLYPDATRFDEIEQIFRFVKEGNSCQIVGFPGVGRTNLLGFLSYNKAIRLRHMGDEQKWFHFVMVHFTELRKRPLSDATKLMFLTLVDSLREREMEEEYQKAREIFKESLAFNDEFVLFQGLKRVIDLLALEKKLTIVFLFDRFEEYVPMLSQEFFSNLRILRNRAKYRFSVVFSLNRPLEDLLEPMLFADFYEFIAGHTIYVPPVDKPGLEFRIAYLEKTSGQSLNEKVKKHLMELTAGHMKLTRLAIEIILKNAAQHSNTLRHTLLEQKPIQGALAELWQALTPEEQTILEAITNNKSVDTADTFLEKAGLIRNGNITIPLLNTYIQALLEKESSQQQSKNDHITIDEQTTDIVKGDLVLSDTLTALEYKLLRHLLQHAEKVIEREEIIDAVWGENASTAGVTDQAVDQLIFRLRRKIEDDPNNPQHLQTVKGRGFRFLP